MPDIHVTIDGIMLYCDESMIGVDLGNGYIITKMSFDEFPFREKVTDGRKQLSIDYLGSSIIDLDGNVHLICIHKEDTYSTDLSEIDTGNAFAAYKNKEMKYLNKVINLLHIFRSGNIGFKEVFFEHKFTIMGLINNTQIQTDYSATKNVVEDRFYGLTTDEIGACNAFLNSVTEPEYLMLKNCIDEFVWGLEQVDSPTGFEQYMTTLEMILLLKRDAKKENLAKRTAVLLETDAMKIQTLYSKMKSFYNFRSKSLHEGNGSSITKAELIEMEDIVRRVLRKYLELCKIEIQINPSTTWLHVRNKERLELKRTVEQKVESGVFS